MIIDDVTDCLIQQVLDSGGKVYAFNGTSRFNVVSAGNAKITIDSPNQEFNVGDKLSFIYVPKYSSPYCNDYADTDGDGIIDLVDLDADGDGVIDPRRPLQPSVVVSDIIFAPDAPSLVIIDVSPIEPSIVRSREYGDALVVDGYYPLYLTEAEALDASPMATPEAHPHELSSHDEHDDIHTYYMPLGVNQWHGNYTNCLPDAPTILLASSVETYDFEYVDRVSRNGMFASIIPFNYENRLLGVDMDENGTYETIENYSLESMFNSSDVFNESGQLLTNGDFKWSHYSTLPRQAWTFEVIQRQESEEKLPDGHSFQMGNYVYHIRTYTKFSPETEDAEKHTQSWATYHSRLTNGNNAEFSAVSGGVVVYNQPNESGGDYWAKKAPLEINSEGYIVMDDDDFSVGDRFYIIEQFVPLAPSSVEAEGEKMPNPVLDVEAEEYKVIPNAVLIVNAGKLAIPIAPSVDANIYLEEQEILWSQFEAGTTTGDIPIVEIEEEEEEVVLLPVNRIIPSEPTYTLKTLSSTADFIKTSPFKTISQAPTANSIGSNLEGWVEANPSSINASFPVPHSTPTYVTQEIFLQKQVVSQALYTEVVAGGNCWLNETQKGDDLPAHNISYYDALHFCRTLNRSQRARGNLPEGWIYMLPSPLVLNRYLGQDFSGTSHYMPFSSTTSSSPSTRTSNAPDLGISDWEGASSTLPLQEITEESRKDVFDSILNAPFGSKHVNVNSGYENRYGFINPFGSVETFTSVGDNMDFLKKSAWSTQNSVINNRMVKPYNLRWSEHPSRVAHYNYMYNSGGTHAYADTSHATSHNGAHDPVNPNPTYHGTWGLARNIQLRAGQDDPNYGDVIYSRNIVLRANIGSTNEVGKGTDSSGAYKQYYPTMTQVGWHNLIAQNLYYFPDTYGIPSDYNAQSAISYDIEYERNLWAENLNQHSVRSKAGMRLMLVNTKSGYLFDTGKEHNNQHELLYKYYN